MRANVYEQPDPRVAAVIDEAARLMPDDHAFILVARRKGCAVLYRRGSGDREETITLVALMDLVGGPFRDIAKQVLGRLGL